MLRQIEDTVRNVTDTLLQTATTLLYYPGSVTREHHAAIIHWQCWRIKQAFAGNFLAERQEWEKNHSDIPPLQNSSIPDYQVEKIIIELGSERVMRIVTRLRAKVDAEFAG